MAELGHDVVGVDVDVDKVEALSRARAPFYEPGFEELLARTLATGRLRFSTDIADAAGCRVHFVCVGTPQKRGEYAADLRYVEAATEALLDVLTPGDLVVGKSTVPVGTAAALADLVEHKVPGALLAWNPEFLREGFAVQDTLHPDRLVYGPPAGLDPGVPPGGLRRGGPPAARPAGLRPAGGPGRGARPGDGRRGVRADRGAGHAQGGERLRHGGDGEDGGELVPGHQDLLHQRD